jgi:hypothetical protein
LRSQSGVPDSGEREKGKGDKQLHWARGPPESGRRLSVVGLKASSMANHSDHEAENN